MHRTILLNIIFSIVFTFTTNIIAQKTISKVNYPYSQSDLIINIAHPNSIANHIARSLLFVNDTLFKGVYKFKIGHQNYMLPASCKQKSLINIQLNGFTNEIELLDTNNTILAVCNLEPTRYSLNWYTDKYQFELKHCEELKIHPFSDNNVVFERKLSCLDIPTKIIYIDQDEDGCIDIVKQVNNNTETKSELKNNKIKISNHEVNFPYYDACLTIDEVPCDPRVPYDNTDFLLFENDSLFSKVRYIEVGTHTIQIPKHCFQKNLVRIELKDHEKCIYLLDEQQNALASVYPNEKSYEIIWFSDSKKFKVKQREIVEFNIEIFTNETETKFYYSYNENVFIRRIERLNSNKSFQLKLTYLDKDEDGIIESVLLEE